MPKLSGPQISFLKDCAKSGGKAAVPEYPPVVKLFALGFIEPVDLRWSWWSRWRATDAGRATLAEST
jgi:hypothetical protein